MLQTPVTALSNWKHNFGNLQFSAKEFYQTVEKTVIEHDIPGVFFSRVSFAESGIFSAKREYLRITRNEYVFDICAAPFGKDFFVSWWLGEKAPGIAAKIPVVSKLLGKDRNNKTYYQVDTESMFRGSIHTCVLEAIDQITKDKGIRALSDVERIPTDTVHAK